MEIVRIALLLVFCRGRGFADLNSTSQETAAREQKDQTIKIGESLQPTFVQSESSDFAEFQEEES